LKKRIYELQKELNVSAKDIVDYLKTKLSIQVNSTSAMVVEELQESIRKHFEGRKK
jgi:hypothetical protein